jgi:hypothetical protein
VSSYGHSTDAEDLKLRFLRFLSFSLSINASAVCLGKSPKFANFCWNVRGASKKRLILAQILHTAAIDLMAGLGLKDTKITHLERAPLEQLLHSPS